MWLVFQAGRPGFNAFILPLLDAIVASSVLAALSCIKFVKNMLDGNLIFADLLQVVETTCIKLVDKKALESTSIKLVNNLQQQTCYHQAGASDGNFILLSA